MQVLGEMRDNPTTVQSGNALVLDVPSKIEQKPIGSICPAWRAVLRVFQIQQSGHVRVRSWNPKLMSKGPSLLVSTDITSACWIEESL